MGMFNIADKWLSSGWNVKEIDGHNMYEIIDGMRWLKSNKDAPSVLIANTLKERGLLYGK